ncbi:hypothetical protein AAFF_G00386110 [Aldrovandia affinis]|uniref:Uncharacterized protein n=1 Tax=Aldrovandia affinis TaxID=143900 RepID=A0AAD7SF82_9TELE|nr:hypothetical protein AAFF_G00386110 [Aldrovandia affinis]
MLAGIQLVAQRKQLWQAGGWTTQRLDHTAHRDIGHQLDFRGPGVTQGKEVLIAVVGQMEQKMEEILKILVEQFRPPQPERRSPAPFTSRVTVMKRCISVDEGQ